MKYVFLPLVILSVFTTGTCYGQDKEIMRQYDRPTVANILMRYGVNDHFENNIHAALLELPQNPKYNIAKINIEELQSSVDRASAYVGLKKGESKSFKDVLRRLVANKAEFFQPVDPYGIKLGEVLSEKYNVGGRIMVDWAARDEHDNFYILEQRSKENLSLNDLKIRKDFKKLMNLERMLRNNYVIVYDIFRQENVIDPNQLVSFQANSSTVFDDNIITVTHAYIYEVVISDDIFNGVVVPNFDKPSKLLSHTYPLKYIGHVATKVELSPSTEYNARYLIDEFKGGGFLNGLIPNKNNTKVQNANSIKQENNKNLRWEDVPTSEQDTFVYNNLARMCFEDVIAISEMNVEAFKVRTHLSSRNPLRAPIGIREGVVADQRYRVYENVLENGSITTKSVGVVRSTNRVAKNQDDRYNADGTEKYTEFKQISGDIIKEGSYLVQENDFGASFSFGPRFGYLKSDSYVPKMIWSFRGEVNVSRTINRILGRSSLYGLYSHFGLGLGTKKYELGDGNLNNLSIDFGLSKRLYFNRKFDIVPELGFTVVAYSLSNDTEIDVSEEGFFYMNLACRGAIRLNDLISIEPAIELPILISVNPYNPASGLHFALRGRIDL